MLVGAGHAVRGTTRDAGSVAAIEREGVEAAIADPNRLSTLTPHLEGVAVLFWLMGSATGEAAAELNGQRLEAILGHIVDTPVRGVVYEGAGRQDPSLLERGAAAVRRASKTHRMPARVVAAHPEDPGAWLEAMRRAAAEVLA